MSGATGLILVGHVGQIIKTSLLESAYNPHLRGGEGKRLINSSKTNCRDRTIGTTVQIYEQGVANGLFNCAAHAQVAGHPVRDLRPPACGTTFCPDEVLHPFPVVPLVYAC